MLLKPSAQPKHVCADKTHKNTACSLTIEIRIVMRTEHPTLQQTSFNDISQLTLPCAQSQRTRDPQQAKQNPANQRWHYAPQQRGQGTDPLPQAFKHLCADTNNDKGEHPNGGAQDTKQTAECTVPPLQCVPGERQRDGRFT
jgi:hypothetical protein